MQIKPHHWKCFLPSCFLFFAAGSATGQSFTTDFESGLGRFAFTDNSGSNAGKFDTAPGVDPSTGQEAGLAVRVGPDILADGSTLVPGAWLQLQLQAISIDPVFDFTSSFDFYIEPEGGADDFTMVFGGLNSGDYYSLGFGEAANSNSAFPYTGGVRVSRDTPTALYSGDRLPQETWYRAVISWTASSKTFNITISPTASQGVTLSDVTIVMDGGAPNRPDIESFFGPITLGLGSYNDSVRIDNFSFAGEAPPVVIPIVAGADVNENGIPDMSELLFPMIAQFPQGEDSDHDGISNIDEARAGTDPFDANSVFRSLNLGFATQEEDTVSFTFSSVPEVDYCIQYSDDLVEENWETITAKVTATGSQTTVTYGVSLFDGNDKAFFRAAVLGSSDTDGDGLEDSLERYLGFSPTSAASVRSAATGGDAEQLRQLMQGANPNGGAFNAATPGVPSYIQSARFLAQAAFGPDTAEIEALQALGDNAFEKWIDQQIAMTEVTQYSTFLQAIADRVVSDGDFPENSFLNPNIPWRVINGTGGPFVDHGNGCTIFFRSAFFSPDQLRVRLAMALSKIIVVNPPENGARQSATFQDILLREAFGSYEDILFEVSSNHQMGRYLSHINNRPADPEINRFPDENFAREIMQLFSIGLFHLNMDGTYKLDDQGNRIPTYGNDDIEQMARVFTGFTTPPGSYYNRLAKNEMIMTESRHDKGDETSMQVYGMREKVFLQDQFYNPPVLPAFEDDPGRSGLDDVRDACRILVNHPSCPPFISRLLIQHLVTSNPSHQYVERVANVFADDGQGARGNLGAVVKAILLDEEARSLSSQFNPHHGKVLSPILRHCIMARATDAGQATPQINELFEGIHVYAPFGRNLFRSYGEMYSEAPSVFSFYSPDYAQRGAIADAGLVSPELEALNSQRAIETPNRLYQMIERTFRQQVPVTGAEFSPSVAPDLTPFITRLDQPEALLDYINKQFCYGMMEVPTRTAMLDTLQQLEGSDVEIAETMLFLAITCAEAATIK